MSENLNTLKEMILDERKLVTYISVSKEMCLHVNESKSLLSQIVEELKNKNSEVDLNVNYTVSGLLENNKAYTAVCNELDLPTLLEKFKIVFFRHLYSVSIGKPSLDNVSLMAVSKFEDLPLCTGLIKSNMCVKRSANEIGALKTTSQELRLKEQKAINTSVTKIKVNSTGEVNDKKVSKVLLSKSEPIIKSESISPKKDPVVKTIQRNDRRNLSKTQKGIAGFFNKGTTSPAKKNPKIVSESEQNNEKPKQKTLKSKENIKVKIEMDENTEDAQANEKPKQETSKSKENIKVKIEMDENTEDAKAKQNDQWSVTKNNRDNKSALNEIKKNAKIDKKRKRVLHVSDSESEDDKNDPFIDEPMEKEDSEDDIPPTPTTNTVKITSGIVNPKKRRKIVDKTYTDEDGYILTKKEEVYESYSENEEEVSVKENVHKQMKVQVSPKQIKNETKPKKKILSPQKGKQATLMSFFKKVN